MSAFHDVLTPLRPEAVRPAKKEILLAEHDASLRRILTRLLEQEGFGIQAATDGAEALAWGAALKFDLVVLDLNLPHKDGLETMEELARKSPLLPIVLISDRPHPISPALATSAVTVLDEPLNFVKLVETIRALLAESLEFRLYRFINPAFLQPLN